MSTLVEPTRAAFTKKVRPLPTWLPAAIFVAALLVAYALLTAVGSSGGGGRVLLAAVLADVIFCVAVFAVSAPREGSRRAKDRVVTAVVYSCFALAVLPLVSLLASTIHRGAAKLTLDFLTHSMRGVGPRDDLGGANHAIIGTVEQVGLAGLIAIPLGLLVAIYLVEYGRGALARGVTFFVDVMTGIPSIVAGLFIFTLFIVILGFGYSGFLGSLALSILMVPTVVRSSEEMLKLVPNELREASLALGVPRWKTILSIVLPTAVAGLVTGVMLAIARVIGETAPLVLTTFFTNSINTNPFNGAQMSLPLYIYTLATQPGKFYNPRAWAAALTLVLIVLLLNLVARTIAWWRAPKAR
ncbi:phosphate ABC transporter membrane protein 2 (PhoT family) [Motilibacter rhizosphaerae]|uniref:Phosphate transport system permease protein PstA n=1 Tax=Motilibacter rhizosphaerae TaxID=598652 RepID=A0A4Q7NUF5_9ACTN|nr:phosphate ABC transporter permease PstA [Motilibacter rhizosphaerae]RZS90797.1 phosphate ABC transporter membrane protein 2 (PhoT family) [Motilibacter rhizosphaerae]